MINVGIIGSTGYAGENVVWILCNHPEAKIIFVNSHSYTNIPFNKIYGNFNGYFEDECISNSDMEDKLSQIDVLFLGLPSGKSFEIVDKANKMGLRVIDMGADFRLKEQKNYESWYGLKHESSHLLQNSVYGLCELNRENIKTARVLANPGCYPTASILAMAPLLKHMLIDNDSIIIDAKSGVSGAGRSASIGNLFCEVNESIKAYAVATHRHTPEIEQELSKFTEKDVFISFTPHLVPMNRGILATCYAKLTKVISEEELNELYSEFYKEEYFVKVLKDLPETRWVKGSNQCHISVRVDKRTNRVIIVSAIDNLMKGAASQAVQNMNIMFGLKETLGLEFFSMAP
ncbi:MAG: N-acetyl-gamma-glutamyl-phosphate reductase [Clostridiaceae bacterium]|nr:N-acetyl-gamma-glutamyl-phosphate reductase [Clostridiaceae bacterium]